MTEIEGRPTLDEFEALVERVTLLEGLVYELLTNLGDVVANEVKASFVEGFEEGR